MGKKRYGDELHPYYNTWLSMKTRCYNPNHQAYQHYGGKGVTVCDRWKHSFKTFVEDMGPRPQGYSLERIKGHLDYSPENCVWASRQEQSDNRADFSTRKLVLVHGVYIGIREAADFLDVPYTSAYREYRAKGSLEKFYKK